MALKPDHPLSRIAAWWFRNLAKGCLGCFWFQTFCAGFAIGWLLAIPLLHVFYAFLL
jgi:hypothetical protein